MMTRIYRWWWSLPERHRVVDYDEPDRVDFRSRAAHWLLSHGFLRRPDSGSALLRDYEWQWRFWRGPYFGHLDHEKRRIVGGFRCDARGSFYLTLYLLTGRQSLIQMRHDRTTPPRYA